VVTNVIQGYNKKYFRLWPI